MKVFKIDKKTESKVQQIKMLVSIMCILNNIILSETELNVLAFFIQYKMSRKTDNLIIESKIVKNVNVLRNIKFRLCKKGFLKRISKEYKTYQLNFNGGDDSTFEDNDIRLILKLSN